MKEIEEFFQKGEKDEETIFSCDGNHSDSHCVVPDGSICRRRG
jgi:hypothetical protein